MDSNAKNDFLGLILLTERLHRRFLDVIKAELERMGVEDINNVQMLILYNIGDHTLTIGELTHRGYYLGSNVSYNVKKLVETGFLEQERSEHDKRSVKVKVSEKGRELCEKIDEFYVKNIEALEETNLAGKELSEVIHYLMDVEKFLSDILHREYTYV